MKLLRYDTDRHKDSVRRIWKEIGWLTQSSNQEQPIDSAFEGTRSWVAELDNEAEGTVNTCSGTIRYQHEDIPISCVLGVATSRIARKRGIASKLTARAIADDATSGAALSILGIFDQGYYNQLGFGTGNYEHLCSFSPSALNVSAIPRTPKRLAVDDWEDIHHSRLNRSRVHGSCTLAPPSVTKSEMLFGKNSFGLGYYKNGVLTHHLWSSTNEPEHGPYRIQWMSYQTGKQLIELLGLVKSLGDQVHSIKLLEPPQIQIQDLISRPFRSHQISKGSKHPTEIRAVGYWQARICNLQNCLERTHLSTEPLKFNLELIDPIESFLDENSSWKGIGGNYIITLGEQSAVERDTNKELPTLRTSVGTFTRLWLGVRTASSLSWTGDLSGPEPLLKALDTTLVLPQPRPDWEL